METFQKAFIAVFILYTIVVGLDYIVYLFKSAPKTSIFTVNQWRVCFVSAAVVLYWIVNGFNF
jgi:hypothetical protein